jgi:hypothetical protein
MIPARLRGSSELLPELLKAKIERQLESFRDGSASTSRFD